MRTRTPYTEHKEYDRYITSQPSSVVEICLNCPLPSCKKVYCKRYEEEYAKLKKEGKV